MNTQFGAPPPSSPPVLPPAPRWPERNASSISLRPPKPSSVPCQKRIRSSPELPAEAHFASAIHRKKIDQSDFQVLYDGPDLLDVIKRIFKRRRAGIAARSRREIRSAVDACAPRHADVLGAPIEFLVRFLILRAMEQRFPQGSLYVGQQPLGFGQGEVSGHGLALYIIFPQSRERRSKPRVEIRHQ